MNSSICVLKTEHERLKKYLQLNDTYDYPTGKVRQAMKEFGLLSFMIEYSEKLVDYDDMLIAKALKIIQKG